MNNFQLLVLTGTTIAGTLFYTTSTHALSFSLNNFDSGSGTFSYDVILDPNESLEADFDYLFLTNLGGVTATNASFPYATDGFDLSSADFIVSDTIAALPSFQTFENVISLTSNNPIGDIDYTATSSFFGNDFEATAQGPVPVPFGVAPNGGIFIIFSIVGFNYCRNKLRFQKK